MFEEFEFIKTLPRVVAILVIILVMIVIYKIIAIAVSGILKKKLKTKKELANIRVFISLIRYGFIILAIIIILFLGGGSFTGLGIFAGLLSAALGWALQRPISGIAAWLMVVTRRPFRIGDRVLIGNVKGDVSDITLTHIYLKEIGGTIESEEESGRTIMIPNAKLFEQDIINYTLRNDFILDQVKVTVTYEGNLKKAIKLCEETAKDVLKEWKEKTEKPFVRTYFQASGIDIYVRYYTIASERQRVSSDITQKIFYKIAKTKGVKIAYPHTEVILKK